MIIFFIKKIIMSDVYSVGYWMGSLTGKSFKMCMRHNDGQDIEDKFLKVVGFLNGLGGIGIFQQISWLMQLPMKSWRARIIRKIPDSGTVVHRLF